MNRRATSPVEPVSPAGVGNDTSEPSNASERSFGGRLRPVSKAQLGDDRLAVTLTLGELRDLVRDAALEAVAEVTEAPPTLLDRSGLARALGIGTSSVDRFRRAGMPAVFVGEAPRFLLDEALAWLRVHRREQPAERTP